MSWYWNMYVYINQRLAEIPLISMKVKLFISSYLVWYIKFMSEFKVSLDSLKIILKNMTSSCIYDGSNI